MATPDAAMEKLALRWSKLARTCKIVPLGEAVEDRTDTMYQIQLSGLTKVPVPKSLLDKVDGSSKTYKLQMHINATLFHVKKGAFFGNTWTGKREDVDGSNLTREKGGDARWNGKPAVVCSLQLPKSYACIFHTKANLADVRLAAELVLTVTDVRGEIRGEEYGICWGLLPLVATKTVADFSKKAEDMTKAPLFAGTPRLLLFLGTDETALSKQKGAQLAGAAFKFVSLKQSKADSGVLDLLNANELVGGTDATLAAIPGVKDQPGAIGGGSGSLKKAPGCTILLKNLAVKVGDGLDAHVRTHVQRATGKSAKLLGLLMEVGVHNGRKFIAAPKELSLDDKGSAKGEYVYKKECKISDYIANSMVAIVVLVYANVEVAGEQGKMCIGWTSVVPFDSSDGGPLLVGTIQLHLKGSQPMACISNAIVFSDDKRKAPTLSLELSTSDKTIKTEPFASRVSAAQAGAVDDSDEEEQDLHVHTPVAHRPEKGKGKPSTVNKPAAAASTGAAAASGRTKQLEAVKGGGSDAFLEGGELTNFTLLCNTQKVGGGGDKTLGPYSVDITFEELLGKLQEAAGKKVLFSYQTFVDDNLGPVKKVVSKSDFVAMMDYLCDDAESGSSVHQGKLAVDLYAVPDKKGELDEIKLHFTKEKITVTLDIEVEWEEALEAIAKAIGRKVYFSWVDGDETVVVDTPEEFEDLMAELEEDWDDDKGELHGEMDVSIVELADASGEVTGQQRKMADKPGRAPSGGKAAAPPVVTETPPAEPSGAASWLDAKAEVEATRAGATANAATSSPAAAQPATAASAGPEAAARVPVQAAASSPAPAAASTTLAPVSDPRRPSPSTPAAAAAPGPAAVAAASAAPPADRDSPTATAPVAAPAAQAMPPAARPAPSAAPQRGEDDNGSAHAARPPSSKKPPPRTSAGRQMMTTEDSEVEGDARSTAPSRRPAGGGDVAATRRQYAVVGESEDTEGDDDVRFSMAKPVMETRTPLSRALKAQIFTSSVKDLVPHYSKDVPLLESGVAPEVVDFGKEVSDPLRSHLIVLQVLAVKLPQTFKRLYFTTRFYTFEPLKTVPATVMRREAIDRDDEAAVPLEVDPVPGVSVTATGVCVTFKVDTDAEEGGEDKARYFAQYLAARSLQIEVWDADAQLPVGSVQVDLRLLLRQGREAVQTAGEFSVTDSSLSLPLPADSGVAGTGVRHSFEGAAASIVASSVGSVFLRLVNVGCLSTGPGASDFPAGVEGASPERPPAGIERVMSLTDEPKGAGSAGSGRLSAEGPVVEGSYPARGLALLLAHKAQLIKQLRADGAKAEAVAVDQLQRSIINLRSLSSSLTVQQVGRLCSHLAQHVAVAPNTVDVTKVVLAGEEGLRKSSILDAAEKDAVLDQACSLLAPLTLRFGSARKACDDFCESTGVMRLQGMSRLVKDLATLDAKITMSDKQCASLLTAVSQGASSDHSVTPGQFAAFFSVQLLGTPAAPAGAAAAGAAAIDKKLARWNKMKAARRADKEASAGIEKERMMQLEAARLYRSVHRDSKIKEVLESSISTEQTVEPAFGEVSYFQYTLRNPYSEERIFGIKFSDHELQLVTDSNEWRHLNRVFGQGGVVEEDMLSHDSHFFNVWLQAHQEVKIPFKLRLRSASPVLPSAAPGGAMTQSTEPPAADDDAPGRRSIAVSFMARRTGADVLVYRLNVHVRPRPVVVDQVFRFSNGENDFLKKRILVDSISSGAPAAGWRHTQGPLPVLAHEGVRGPLGVASEAGPRKHAWASMEKVIVRCEPNAHDSRVEEVHLKFRCDKAGETTSFYVVLYNDEYLTSVYEVWQFHISTMQRVDVQGFVGEIERQGCGFALRSAQGPKAVKAYTSHPAEVLLDSASTLTVGQQLTEVPFQYQPLQAGRRDVLVNFVDTARPGAPPLFSYLVTARARVPLVSKRYDIRLPLGKPCNKKIMYTNPYSVDKTFRLRTDQPKLLSFRDNLAELAVGAKGQQYIGLRFAARRAGGNTEVLVFINDEHDRTEECLCISIQYVQ